MRHGCRAIPPAGNKPVIKGISFSLDAGEALAVIGPSASGKSTLARLLVGILAPTAGHVRLDGADVSRWDHEALGPDIGYVPQDVELFDGTVSENIARFNEPDAAKVVAAARKSGVHEMVLRLPEGYDTRIGEAGSVLSGGQRQRIALARALYGEPSFIVLDEPNSNMDGEGEEALRTTLGELKRAGKTVVVITHRPSIIQVADKVLVLRDGQVEQFGMTAEVMQRLGRVTQPLTSVATKMSADSARPRYVMNHSKPKYQIKPPANPRPSIFLGLGVILVGFFGFGAWAAVASIASGVVAPGTVTVDSNRKKVQHLEGGVVRDLLVRDGDVVKAGDILIRLDEIRPQATLAILQTRYDSALASQARLLAEQQDLEKILFPEQLLIRSSEAKVAEILAGQTRLFEARRNSLAGETEILENRITQLQNDVRGIEAQQRAKERQISLVKEELESIKGLLDKGYTDRPRYLALQREAARLEGERGELISEIARTNTKIGETQLEIIQLRKSFREQVVTDLRAIGADVADLEERIGAARHTLEHIEVRAPVDGVVVGMEVHTVGGVIRAGDTILEVVPVNDELIIEVRVQPQDIDNITIGMQAGVQFTAFKQRTTPRLQGQVTYLSADRFVDDRTGEAYYSAHIRVSEEEVKRLGDHRLQPGMPAEIMIKTGERTAFQYLLQPFVDSLEKAWREE